MRRLLRGRAGRLLGRRLAVLRYTGVRSGRTYEPVVLYARTGSTVWVLVGGAEHKTWWRNLLAPADVVVRLAGEDHAGRAVAVVGRDQPEEAQRGLTAFLAALPAAGRSVGLRDRKSTRLNSSH